MNITCDGSGEKDGLYGIYYEKSNGSDCTVSGLFGSNPNNYMAKSGVKWLKSHDIWG